MKIRDTCLYHRHAFIQDALTWTFPIDIVDPVTEFKVHFRCRVHTSAGVAANYYFPPPLPYVIEEIAVIDGSEVIYALNGAECVAMSTFDLGYMPFMHHTETPGMTVHWCFPIHFGRSLVDPEWIFDPKKFKNPQIRITWDLAAVVPVGAGGFQDAATRAIEISIWAKIMEEGARPRGYLMTKQIKEYTPAGAGDEVTWLPTDFPIRKLMARSYIWNGKMSDSTTHIKLSQDQDKWIPFDLEGDDFIRLMKNWFTEVQTYGIHWMGDSEYREHFGGELGRGLVNAASVDQICVMNGWFSNCLSVRSILSGGARPHEDSRIEVWHYGQTRVPFDCYCYPFGDQENAADWLQVAPMGNLRLILTHASEAPEPDETTTWPLVQIVTQQAHPY